MPPLAVSGEGILASLPDLAVAVTGLDRSTHWELVGRQPLSFPTHHPQGLAFVAGRTFVASVEITEQPIRNPDPARRTTGAGIGHLFVMEDGKLTHDLQLGDGAIYHPGGIDFDGESVWMSVAEYRGNSRSIVYSVDPVTLAVRERFRVDDHVGWVVRDPELDVIYGGTWGSRRFYTWTTDGREVDCWENPSSFIDYQDCQFVAPGVVLCSGIAVIPQPAGADYALGAASESGAEYESGPDYELGGIALVDIRNRRIVHELPVPVFSDAGHVLTRNPFAVTWGTAGLELHVAPDDGDDLNGTELLTYVPSRPTH